MASQKGASWNLHGGDRVKKCAQNHSWVARLELSMELHKAKGLKSHPNYLLQKQLVLEDQETINITKPTTRCSTKCRNHRLKVHQPGSPNRWYNVLRGLGVILYSVTLKHQLMQAMEVSPWWFGGLCYCYFMLLCHQELRTCKMYPKFSTCTQKSWKSYQCILIRTVTIHQVWSS